MKKMMISIFLVLVAFNAEAAPDFKKLGEMWRSKVGPVYTQPAKFNGKFYLLSSTGVLFQTTSKMKKGRNLFKTDKNTISGILRVGNTLYFGEGLHEDKKTSFYAFDIKKEKLKFKIPLNGHVEKMPIKLGDLVIIPAGPGGLVAIDRHSGKLAWKLNQIGKKKLHVDSSPLVRGSVIYFGSIYTLKAVIAYDTKKQKVLWKSPMSMAPKSDLRLTKDLLVTLNTDANLMKKNRLQPAEIVAINVDTGKIVRKQKLRGFNVYPQHITKNQEVFFALSTGDIGLFNLSNGKLDVLDQFPEPFISSTYTRKNQLCAVSIQGRIACYKNKKRVSHKRMNDHVIGDLGSNTRGPVFVPTRMGYRILK